MEEGSKESIERASVGAITRNVPQEGLPSQTTR